MIKINLLESVTDRPRGGVAAVEEKVTNPVAQTILHSVIVAVLLFAGMGYDYFSAHWQKANAMAELQHQKQINDEMNAVNRERADLEKKVKEIQDRIDAIQKLRASQQGPSAVLASLRERVNAVPGLFLQSVEQKGDSLEIVGLSPDEAAVTRFGQSLEFSSGLFSNLNITTERKPAEMIKTSSANTPPAASPQSEDPNAPKPQVVAFTIKCSYKPPQQQSSQNSSPSNTPPANQVAQR